MAGAVVHVVEDDDSFRTSIARLLRAVGYEVAVYKSGQRLLDALPDDGSAGCILLDVHLPGLSGPELQSRLTEIGYALPIVFLTGNSEAINAGAEDFLYKPVSKHKLIDAIERALRRLRRAGASAATQGRDSGQQSVSGSDVGPVTGQGDRPKTRSMRLVDMSPAIVAPSASRRRAWTAR